MASRRSIKLLGALAVTLSAVALAGCSTNTSPNATTQTTSHARSTTSTTITSAGMPKGTPVPAGFSPMSFSAISATAFWLLGTSGTSTARTLTLVRTTDGAKSFVAIPAPPISIPGPGQASTFPEYAEQVRFGDALDGYVYNGASPLTVSPVYDTHDGGATWSKLSLPGLLAFAIGGGFAYAVSATCKTGRCTNVVLHRTPVNQEAWSQIAMPVTSIDSLVSLTVHGNSLWMTATTASGTTQNQTLIYSSDTGMNLTIEKSPCYSGLGGSLEAASSTVLWAVCPTGMESSAFRSADAGASWQPVSYHPMANSAVIAPASATVATIAPGGGILVRVTQGGAMSNGAYSPPSGQTPFWSFVGFTTTQVGAALAEVPASTATSAYTHEQLFRTTDQGQNWTPVPIAG